jgi:hypothetical protein
MSVVNLLLTAPGKRTLQTHVPISSFLYQNTKFRKSPHLSDPGRCEIELPHLRAGEVCAVAAIWLRTSPLLARSFIDIFECRDINMMELFCCMKGGNAGCSRS